MLKSTLVIIALLPGLSFAGSLVCEGQVTRIGNHAPGGLHVQVGELPMIKICSFNEQLFRHSPEDCKHIASLAQQAFATNTPARIYIDNTSVASCGSMPAWSSVDLRIFSLQK